MRGWTDDVIQLADALDLDRFGVIGWSSGATYALACAAVIPDRVTRAGEIGGSGWPIDEEPGALERLSEADRRIHALAQSDPAAAIPLAEQRAAEWVTPLREHPELIMDENDPPQDMRHFDDAAWAANFYEAIAEGVRIGPRCTAWDTVAGYAPWGFGLEDVTIEFHIWHGAHDPVGAAIERRLLGRSHSRCEGHGLRRLGPLRRRRSLGRDARHHDLRRRRLAGRQRVSSGRRQRQHAATGPRSRRPGAERRDSAASP